jgi:hypothetical protein
MIHVTPHPNAITYTIETYQLERMLDDLAAKWRDSKASTVMIYLLGPYYYARKENLRQVDIKLEPILLKEALRSLGFK